MFRNQYDSDVTVWSPQGRLHQVDYAVEAMNQGSATVGIKSKTHAVIVALKRATSDLCSHQKKIFELDEHLGASIAGLLSDGRILARFLQTEASSWRWDYKTPVPLSLLCNRVQLKLQANTQYYGRRPFGVGLLIAGFDKEGPHIIKTEPSAEVVEAYAASIGSRSQSARTYLERKFDEFEKASLDELITHALIAIRDTLPADENLTTKNTSIAFVGKGQKFKCLEDEDIKEHLDKIVGVARAVQPGQAHGQQPDQAGGQGGQPGQGGPGGPQGGGQPGAMEH
ncbi:unnamed protein product, partial [Mesorhabditis belari]|uniref:Proteasome subunit alpha type n=1 Tax=Mesorhabditis belari TaxID=2138241 RepID=A0AAF3EFP8_9BILA